MKKLFLLALIPLFLSCKTEIKKAPKIAKKRTIKIPVVKPDAKDKVGSNTYTAVVKRTRKFADELNFNLDYIRKKGLPDKKYLAEFLGLYLKLQKASKTEAEKRAIKKRIEPFYKETLEPAYHNMGEVNDKLFKKNSMSYMRIMWLFNEMGFDITKHKQELAKVQKRMDTHMRLRGEWQRAVFDKYYDYFKLKKPPVIQNAKRLKGPISTRKPLSFYTRANGYIITHFVFAAYDYGNKKVQTRFTKEDITYLKEILPQIIVKFEAMQNDDLVGELLTCQVLIDDTKSVAFKKSLQQLMDRQNKDGSWGSYEKYRNRLGSDVEFRTYMHTTLVDFETFVEFEARK